LNLGDVSRDALLARLRHWNRRATRNGPPAVSRDEARAIRPYAELFSPGMELYGRYCAGCHGDDGWPPERGLGGPEGPTVLFDRQYMEAHDDSAIAARVWHMLAEQWPRMPHLQTRVSDGQVGTIVRYLRARYHVRPVRAARTRPR
jgi:mono/diheme cytochrome c family protein